MKNVENKPIDGDRKPIKLSFQERMKLKLQEMQVITKDGDIFKIIRHYNMLVSNIVKRDHRSVSNDAKKHKNWTHFEYVYEICRLKNWDALLYIEAQFDRSKHWGVAGLKYPPPNYLHSDAAIKYMMGYINKMKQNYKEDIDSYKRLKHKETLTLSQQTVGGITKTIKVLSLYIENTKIEDKTQYKAMKIFESWEMLSPFYLWTVPWFHKVLDELPRDSDKYIECKGEFDRISNNSTLQKLIKMTVQQIEKQFNIPDNLDL